MTWTPPDDDQVREILATAKSVAIVGISNKSDRPSYGVALWLTQNTPYSLYFVNPTFDELFGLPVYPHLADIPAPIDIVDVFRNPKDARPVLDQSIAIGAKTFFLQLGLFDQGLGNHGDSCAISVVMDRCIKIEYERLISLPR